MFVARNQLTKTILGCITAIAISAPAYADGPFYNCQSDASNFNVSILKDSDGTWCVWKVRTGVVTPVGGYQPNAATFDAIKFQVAKPSIANCSPQSFNASEMQFDGVTLACSYIPVGATNRPQEVDYNNFMKPFNLQQFVNNQWTPNTGGCYGKDTVDCRVAPGSDNHK